jgi:hypothetical protein
MALANVALSTRPQHGYRSGDVVAEGGALPDVDLHSNACWLALQRTFLVMSNEPSGLRVPLDGSTTAEGASPDSGSIA